MLAHNHDSFLGCDDAPRTDGAINPIKEGDILEPYRLLETIGGGEFTTVHRVEHQWLGSPAVAKVLPPALSNDPDARERLTQEARLTSALAHHRNVVSAHDFIIGRDGRLALVLELVRGETLEAMVTRDARISIEDALAIGAQLADALAAVHAAGVVHAALNPRDVLIARDGAGRPSVKLIDFGDAVSYGRAARGPVRHRAFASPEAKQGGRLDQRSDLYSLAALMHYLVSGRVPEGTSELRADIVALIHRTALPSAALAGARFVVARDLDRLLGGALSGTPAERPSSAVEFRDRLDRLTATLTGEVAVEPSQASDDEYYEALEISLTPSSQRPADDADKGQVDPCAPTDFDCAASFGPHYQSGTAAGALSLILVIFFGLAALIGRAWLVEPAFDAEAAPTQQLAFEAR